MLVAFYKPYGVVSQFTAPPNNPTAPTLAAFGLPAGLYAAGRLDHDSEGLLLLTDDGALQNRLADPRHKLPKTYLAQVERIPTDEALRTLRAGPMLKDGPTRPCQARLLDGEPPLPPRHPPIRYRANIATAWVEIVLTEGRNRQVRRMTAAVGFPTLRLVRVALGPIGLTGLQPGEWREVDPRELTDRR